MLNKDLLTAVFQNIVPATFEDSQTYLEQLLEVQKVLNEVVDVVNGIVESGGSGYILEPATSQKLGGVKIGEGVNVAEDGTISVDVPDIPEIPEYELPIANDERLGGVIIGDGIDVDLNGRISVTLPDNPDNPEYELPIATESTLGGVKSSNASQGLYIDPNTGKISLQIDFNSLFWNSAIGVAGKYSKLGLKPATATTLGGVKIGKGINVDSSGKISVDIPEVSIELGQGLKLIDGKITLDLGQNLFFTEDGKVNAVSSGPSVITTGIQESVNSEKTGSSNTATTENINVNDSVYYEKY